MGTPNLKFDQIGYWSQVKLDIVRDYAQAYSRILSKQPSLKHIYIDAFAGAGQHQLKTTGELVPGSPLNALNVDPPFREVHLIDMDGAKIDHLRQLIGTRGDVFLHHGDTNRILIDEIFPTVRYRDFRRALCLLDPYGLTLSWEVLLAAARMSTIEIFLNFPVMDMNRNALWSDPSGVAPDDLARMNAFWGDESWRDDMYTAQGNLFGNDDLVKTGGNEKIANAFCERLRNVAGFKKVPPPIPMRNTRNAVVYYLFFASNNATGSKIAEHILKRYASHRAA